MFMGAMPKIVKGVISAPRRRHPRRRRHPPQRPVPRRDALPRRRDRRSRSSTTGELVGFSGASAHLLDIGGAYPGLAVDLVDNWSEGNIYRAVKLSEKGVRQEALWRHILENTRTPTYNRGDIQAMIAACELAKRRYLELLEPLRRRTRCSAPRATGSTTPSGCCARRSRRCRTASTRPRSAGSTTTARNRGKQLPVKVKVIIEGDEITIDLTGSSDEVPTGYNCPYEGTTVSAMTFITRMIFLDEAAYPVFVPQNEGMLEAGQGDRPEGLDLQPELPARLLRPLLPGAAGRRPRPARARAGRARAGHRRQLRPPPLHLLLRLQRGDSGEYWVYLEVDEGSYGGRADRDGLDSVDCLIANTRNNPIEELEWRFPMRTERYELRDDPCAAGEWRGGIGMVRVNRFLDRHDRHLRGRAPRVRRALGHLRRPRRHQRLAR